MKKLLIILAFLFIGLTSYGQSAFCNTADPFCTGTTYNFPLATNTTAEVGPDYDCLFSQPNPVWYYLQIDQSGDLTITMSAGSDIDFVCWGPFGSLTNICSNLTAGNVVDCSYSTAATENCFIPGAVSGEFYMICITNYANVNQNITFSQTSGTGSTDCSIMCNVDAGPDQQICLGEQAVLGGTPVYNSGLLPVTYLWDNAGSIVTLATDSTPTVEPLVTTTYTVTMTTDDGCTVTDDVTITVIDLQIDNIATVDDNCGLNNGEATVTMLNGTAPYTYDIGSASNTTGTFTNLGAGPYNVTVTDDDGCTTTQLFTINPIGNVTSGFTVNDIDQCLNGNSFDFTNTGDTGPGITWTWSFPIGTPSISSNEDVFGVIWSTPGTYTITQTAILGTCNDVTTMDIFVFEHPTITNFTVVDATCNAVCDGTAQVNPANGTPGYTYEWDIATGNQVTQTAIDLCAGNYFVTVTDINGCTVMDGVTVGENPAISVIAELSTDVTCAGYGDGFIDIDAMGGCPPLEYDIGTTPNNTGEFPGLNGGTYTVTVTDCNGCTVTSNPITIAEPSQITIDSETVTDITCYGFNDGIIQITASGGTGTLTYNIGTGAFGTGVFGGLQDGNYTVTITDVNGCSITEDYTIVEPAKIVMTAGPLHSIVCMGDDVLINASATGGTGVYTYVWNGVAGSSSMNVTNIQNPTSFVIQVEDDNGCLSNLEVAVIEMHSQLDIAFIPNTDNVCPGDPAIIDWQIIDGGQGGPYTFMLNGDIVTPPYTVYPTTTTTYDFTISDICSQIDRSVTITVNPVPSVSFSSDITSGCQPLTVCFNEMSGELDNIYMWNLGNDYVSMTQSPCHTFDDPGTYDITLTIQNEFGCENSNTLVNMINVYPLPEASFIANPTMVEIINPIISFENYSEGNYHNYWFFGDRDSSNQVNPLHTYNDIGTYIVELVVVNQYGCSDTVFSNVEVIDVVTFFAPTAFSPDNDGLNDEFIVVGKDISDNFMMNVYDRWGEVIWETHDCDDGWDGRAKQSKKVVQNGVYVWRCTFTDVHGISREHVGVVTVIR